MFSPVFDGQFCSKPTVSLRGASKLNEPSLNLLHKAHQLREERELLRKQTNATIIIQSYVRGYNVRKQVYGELRYQFDESISLCTDHKQLLSITRCLMMFYNETKDYTKLASVCHKWIIFKSVDLTLANCLHLMYRLITICLQSLRHNPFQPLANCMRLIDVYSNSTLYPRQQTVNHVLQHLIRNGYFSILRYILEKRLPPPDEDTPLTLPLATELIHYIERGTDLGIFCLSDILRELLAPPLSPHLCYLILPSLMKSHLSLQLLLDTCLQDINNNKLMATPTLCYCLLLLSDSNFVSLSNDSITNLLIITARMLEGRVKDIVHRDRDHEDNDDEENMELDPLGGDTSLTACILDIINTGPLVGRLSQRLEFSYETLDALCSLSYHVITQSLSPLRSHLLCSLSFSSSLLRQIWLRLNSLTLSRSFGSSTVSCIDHLSRGLTLTPIMSISVLELLSTYSCLFSISLSSLHDSEVTSLGPFTLHELTIISLKLRDIFIVLHLETHLPNLGIFKATPTHNTRPRPSEWTMLSDLLCRLLKQLHSCNVRLGFCPSECWPSLSLVKVPPELFLIQDDEELASLMISHTAIKHAELLKRTPFVFPFTERVTFFQRLIAYSRTSAQGHLQEFMIGPSLSITARRTYIYDDAFSELSNADLRKRLRVNLINAQGLDEAGIDGGGLFREFLSETIKTGYDPNRGYFITSQDGALYPNPQVDLISDDNSRIHYQFLGGLLGKALYEHMLVELPFASFFLRKLTTPGRGWVDTHYLSSLDPELYHHLLSLKQYEGDIDELGLDFTTLSNEYGQIKLVELKPGGRNISVTWSNRIEYIHLLAQHHLNIQLNKQFHAFRQGVNNVVPLLWLTLFNEQELQTLISGAEVSIDLDDLYKHTHYSGVYNSDHETIKFFWMVVRQFDERQKQQLLKFVTSCSHPPLLGFCELHPPFSILSARETDHLPSASTCMHLLKLPMFSNVETLREKLIYAISSGAGFELS